MKTNKEIEMLALMIALTGCQWDPTTEGLGEVTRVHGVPETRPGEVEEASAKVRSADGTNLGTVTFTAVDDGVKVSGKLTGFAPNSTHAIHLHEGSTCGEAGFEAAGDHFNPRGEPHGAPDDPRSHAGDLGNVVADADGVAAVEVVKEGLAFNGAASVVDRTFVVHADPDDLKSQPAGAAGDRMACAEIAASSRVVPVDPAPGTPATDM